MRPHRIYSVSLVWLITWFWHVWSVAFSRRVGYTWIRTDCFMVLLIADCWFVYQCLSLIVFFMLGFICCVFFFWLRPSVLVWNYKSEARNSFFFFCVTSHLGFIQEIFHLVVVRLLVRSQYVYRRPCDRPSRFGFSWFPTFFKHSSPKLTAPASKMNQCVEILRPLS
jgi:hypothetical protein